MSTSTTNYGFTKPAAGENYSRSVLNNNYDLIDTEIKETADRLGIPFAHMGRTNSFQTIGTGAATKVLMEQAQVLIGGFTFSDADDALIIPKTGRYTVRLKAFFTGGASETNQAGLIINGVSGPAGPHQSVNLNMNKSGGGDVVGHSSSTMPFNQGDKIGMFVGTASSTWGTNGYDGSFIEFEWAGAW